MMPVINGSYHLEFTGTPVFVSGAYLNYQTEAGAYANNSHVASATICVDMSNAGASCEMTFIGQLPSYFTSKEGTLYYVCEPHVNMGMRGQIIIQSAPEIAMEFGDFPWLSYLLVFPLIGALWILGFRNNPEAPRIIALFTTLFTLGLSVIVFFKAGSGSGFRSG